MQENHTFREPIYDLIDGQESYFHFLISAFILIESIYKSHTVLWLTNVKLLLCCTSGENDVADQILGNFKWGHSFLSLNRYVTHASATPKS